MKQRNFKLYIISVKIVSFHFKEKKIQKIHRYMFLKNENECKYQTNIIISFIFRQPSGGCDDCMVYSH